MDTLYARLFRYKARPDREPLEDFLSEALADLLGRMPREEVTAFLDHAFQEAGATFFSSQLAGAELEWRTQEAVPGGIVDLALFTGGAPRLVIENKTWSGFQDHSTDDEEANQLHTYCRWLAAECPDGMSHGVLLITGTTSSPPGFHGGDGYAVSTRAQITWAAVGRWLSARAAATDADGATWRDLAADFVQFIREKKLSSEVFVPADVSAAHLVLPTMDRWSATFDTIWQGGKLIWAEFLNARVSDLLFHSEAGMLWHWRYSRQSAGAAKTWVALGLRFPDQSGWYGSLSLSQPHFIFIVGSDDGALECAGHLPPDWIRDDEDGRFLLARATDSFGDRPDERVEQLQDWAKTAMEDARSILRNCKVV